jgi:hypothetical protein
MKANAMKDSMMVGVVRHAAERSHQEPDADRVDRIISDRRAGRRPRRQHSQHVARWRIVVGCTTHDAGLRSPQVGWQKTAQGIRTGGGLSWTCLCFSSSC